MEGCILVPRWNFGLRDALEEKHLMYRVHHRLRSARQYHWVAKRARKVQSGGEGGSRAG